MYRERIAERFCRISCSTCVCCGVETGIIRVCKLPVAGSLRSSIATKAVCLDVMLNVVASCTISPSPPSPCSNSLIRSHHSLSECERDDCVEPDSGLCGQCVDGGALHCLGRVNPNREGQCFICASDSTKYSFSICWFSLEEGINKQSLPIGDLHPVNLVASKWV